MIKRMIIMLFAVGLVLGSVYGFQVLKTNLIAKALSDYAAAPQTVSATKVAPQSWQPMLRRRNGLISDMYSTFVFRKA